MHTPGPWQIAMSADRTPAVMVPTHTSEGSGFVVAHINRPPRLGSVRGSMDANARLIAAAPDMLAALEWARMCVPFPSDCHAAVVAAIAKVKGEAA